METYTLSGIHNTIILLKKQGHGKLFYDAQTVSVSEVVFRFGRP